MTFLLVNWTFARKITFPFEIFLQKSFSILAKVRKPWNYLNENTLVVQITSSLTKSLNPFQNVICSKTYAFNKQNMKYVTIKNSFYSAFWNLETFFLFHQLSFWIPFSVFYCLTLVALFQVFCFNFSENNSFKCNKKVLKEIDQSERHVLHPKREGSKKCNY